MPPPPRRAMVPDRNCRQLDCPVPIAHRGGGSAEVALEAAFSYNGHVLADTTKIENGIMPPPPRRAMVPDRNCRQLNCPVPIAHRGGGSAEVALEAAFSYNIHGRKTCHNEKRKSFNSSTLMRLSYKKSGNLGA